MRTSFYSFSTSEAQNDPVGWLSFSNHRTYMGDTFFRVFSTYKEIAFYSSISIFFVQFDESDNVRSCLRII